MNIFVRKKAGFDVITKKILKDLQQTFHLEDSLKGLDIYHLYQVRGISQEIFDKAIYDVFAEINVDEIYTDSEFEAISKNVDFVLGTAYHSGQFDVRAFAAKNSLKILDTTANPDVVCGTFYIFDGNLSQETKNKINDYLINKIDSREINLGENLFLDAVEDNTKNLEIIGFNNFSKEQLANFLAETELAMNLDDLILAQDYFKTENRNPSITEIKILDTYWSDHCRHTTFLTDIKDIKFEDNALGKRIEKSYNKYIKIRKELNRNHKSINLMDMATIITKKLVKDGYLTDLDISEEINACSFVVDATINGKVEPWIVMFKNETHNHPTEVEPFGGASTCLGGAIRDPLSGRTYVYQAMRVTGSADPRESIENTIAGKLPQKKITTLAAKGYSSYGNQIGLATGEVSEYYDESYKAKRMEVGAVIAAAPKENIYRSKVLAGDKIILLGGKTGRDGCGGATGSSKEHKEETITKANAEVQKGNPVEERKIQRFFRNSEVSLKIKKCNDFGAGGVSVAVGELADSLDIYLDNVPKKYQGLNATEIAISESQERMAVVVDKKDVNDFIELAKLENLEATVVANVTNSGYVNMFYRNEKIVSLSREFLDTNGASRQTEVFVKSILEDNQKTFKQSSFKKLVEEDLQDLNVASKKDLSEMFDSTIGSSTVLQPYGGKYQLTPACGMASKLPIPSDDVDTVTVMSHGFAMNDLKHSPYLGAMYTVVDSVSKAVAMGVDYKTIKLSFQEYFEKLGNNPEKWGKVASTLLGALEVQENLKISAIGGKDSMSGTFKDLNVLPTFISFTASTANIKDITSNEFKNIGSKVYLLNIIKDNEGVIDFDKLKEMYEFVNANIKLGNILSANTTKGQSTINEVLKSLFGNKLGITLNNDISLEELFKQDIGSIIIEVNEDFSIDDNINNSYIGQISNNSVVYKNETLDINELVNIWIKPLNNVFSARAYEEKQIIEPKLSKLDKKLSSKEKISKPKVFMPVFPGTNCEYDTKAKFVRAGANVETFIFKDSTQEELLSSINAIVEGISKANILILPGGFSMSDEPEGSAKFIVTTFKNDKIKKAVMDLIQNRDGLILGICNGFQALIKLGLLPYGEIKQLSNDCPTLTYNNVARHISTIANTKLISNKSPWLQNLNFDTVYKVPMSHGEGRIVLSKQQYETLLNNGQIATNYCDLNGNIDLSEEHNINKSSFAVEGLISPCGRILGKMGHSERIYKDLYKNIPDVVEQAIFQAGVDYFKK